MSLAANPEPVCLADLNAMDLAPFVAALSFAFERSPWVVEGAHASGPFDDLDSLWRTCVAVLEAASPEARLALIRAHPELAGRAARAGEITAESRAEQAGAGLDRLSDEDDARFSALNAAYGARFGFPFIICARLNDKASILAAMARRLAHGRDEEIAEAIAQIALIGRLRLFDGVKP